MPYLWQTSKLFYKLWWCGVSSDTGVYNLIGVCDDKRKRSSKKNQVKWIDEHL